MSAFQYRRLRRSPFMAVTLIFAMSLTADDGGSAVNQTTTLPTTRPYGEWMSPITTDQIVAESIRVSTPLIGGTDVYWLEGRPQEAGRSVLVRRSADGQTSDVTPAPFNVRTRVHEYGGGPYLVANGVIYFSNFSDQRIYKIEVGSVPQPITPDSGMRFADYRLIPGTHRLVAVREDHSGGGEAVNTLVLLDIEHPSDGIVLAAGNDFYSAPRVSPDGRQLAWLTWNHPNMPWDGTELWLAEISTDGNLADVRQVGGGKDTSVFQPDWSPGGVLYFVSDRSGWWNLHRLGEDGIEDLYPADAEFGQPMWGFGMSTYGFESDHSILCVYTVNASDQLARLNLNTKTLTDVKTAYTNIGSIQVNGSHSVFVGGSPSRFSQVVMLGGGDSGSGLTLQESTSLEVDEGYISQGRAIEFPTEHGLTAHAYYYAPANKDFRAPDGERPPLLLMSHGGPTGATSDTLSLPIQFWTSRGIAVVDVNYGGSTGYGRAYRKRLNGNWGIVDVDDSVNATRYLVAQGLADGERLAIRGGSAGGYTTLAALTFRDVFKAGASYFGISDLETLVRDTHKFESRYIDSMVGPYPQSLETYQERSPINHIDDLNSSVIFFQGLEDKVVPPNQAEMMFTALKERGVQTAYLAFEGEGHGFRKAENQKRSLDAELYFYGKVLGFAPAGNIDPVAIANAR